jgi:hypothetical protein
LIARVRRGGEVEGFGGCGRGWGRNGKKWRAKKRLDRDAWRGVKVEKGLKGWRVLIRWARRQLFSPLR